MMVTAQKQTTMTQQHSPPATYRGVLLFSAGGMSDVPDSPDADGAAATVEFGAVGGAEAVPAVTGRRFG